MSFRPDSIPRRCVGAEGQRFGEEFMVLDPAGEMLRGLNGTGARVWALCDGQRTARDIAETLADGQDVAREQVLADCLGFLSQLAGYGLIEELRAEAGASRQEVPR